MSLPQKEYRCSQCHRLLFKGRLVECEIEIKCKSCNTMNLITESSTNDLLCLIPRCPHRIAFETPPPAPTK